MSRDAEIERLVARIEELESIVENSPDIISRFDRELRHVYVNRAVEAASGLKVADFVDKTHAELGMPDELVEPWREVYRQVFESGVEGRKEFEFPGPDGPRSYVSRVVPERGPDGAVRTVLSVARDVTDWKRAEQRRLELERRLQEANKLESLGLLAGGVAHDFNNLLTGVVAGASLLITRSPSVESTRAIAQRIEESALRAADLCRQLLAYAGRAQRTEREIVLGTLAHDTANLLGTSIRPNVRVELTCEDADCAVIGDPVQLQQVFMNLLLNAAEAIGEAEGSVRISTRSIPGGEVPLAAPVTAPDACEGPHVHVQIADDGRGMDPETQARIFEPFFTTHFQGRGLGLAAVLGTVRAHAGVLCVTSSPGVGTTFDLYLPSVVRSAAAASVQARTDVGALDGIRLLIVDDESGVLDATERLALSVGMVPTTVPGGRAALDHLRGASDVDIVLLDLTMPELDGVETLRRIRTTHPEVPVVLMSGFAEAESLAAADEHRVSSFLHKPFGMREFLAALSDAVAPEP